MGMWEGNGGSWVETKVVIIMIVPAGPGMSQAAPLLSLLTTVVSLTADKTVELRSAYSQHLPVIPATTATPPVIILL